SRRAEKPEQAGADRRHHRRRTGNVPARCHRKRMTRLQEIRAGFERPFWVANITEIFERLSYYAVFATLARYLYCGLGFPQSIVTRLGGLFGGAVWILAIFGGALTDRLGFRRALASAYFILTCAYFLIGSIGAPWMAPVRSAMPLSVLTGIV